MKFSIRMYATVIFISLSVLAVGAQDNHNTDINANRHQINISYSDGLTLGGASFWGIGLADAITGTHRTDECSTGVFGLGYRYAFTQRFRLGLDFGFAKITSKLTTEADTSPSIKEKELNFLVLPTAEFVYLRHKFFQLYGSASVGIDLSRHYESGLTKRGNELAQEKSKFDSEFAFQINPIGIRVGNNSIGGFIEAGLGYRGFITAGVSLGF